jgi:hypothetical protein
LLTRPGGVAREYVEGKRRRHYGPFATLAVIVGVTALEINASGFQVLAHDWLPSRPADLLQQHFNLLLLAQLPLLGGVCALVFRRASLTWPEHMVLVGYALSMRAAVVALSVPVAYLTASAAPELWQVFGFWVAWYVYFGWAASQFYAGHRVVSWVRGSLTAAIGHLAIMLILLGGSAAYEALNSVR